MNIYIGNFSYDIMGDDLKEIFGAYGYVEKVNIIRDKFTGESRGFGFVEMPNRTEAEAAMRGISEVKGKRVTINEARPQAKRSSFTDRGRGTRDKNSNRRDKRYY
jgi:RNA recognition motif-containing protein